MWGQVALIASFCVPFRIIPTRVGTRIDDLYTESEDEDHPHACGDKACENYYVGDGIGSSPRVWGQVVVYISFRPKLQDHPHACGDKFTRVKVCFLLGGSSPRVWGQVQDEFAQQERRRIIPTRVGTSILYGYFRKVERDHPHACGDKSACFKLAKSVVGSSPRVWGQVTKGLTKWITTGIIPTRVGTSCACDIFPLFSKDHPHACGDKFFDVLYQNLCRGSSPRVWGQEGRSVPYRIRKGIIPTRVGTRGCGSGAKGSFKDHPHACGDKFHNLKFDGSFLGSSPRVWGQDSHFI